MGNFIDKTFTVLADMLLKVLPASKKEKQAFSYYRAGMTAQTKGRYSEALENYYEALTLEEDPYDRSYTLYNIGLIYCYSGRYTQSLEFYHQALNLNPNLPQSLYNIGIIYHMQGTRAEDLSSKQDSEEKYEQYINLANKLYDKAGEYWRRAIKLAPDNYPGVINWLVVTGRREKNLDDYKS
jgi:tetratricopeptide (TPR) repeat protein